MARIATESRTTGETKIQVTLNLDGSGKAQVDTGVGFLDHMLDQIARHGGMDLEIEACGDQHIDDHHTVEDVGITMGQAFRQAIGDRRGITRFGHAYVPLDEALSRVVVDLSNRPSLSWRVKFPTQKVGNFDTELFKEWFAAFAQQGGITMHVESLYGENSHHIAESCFKALARALRSACAVDATLGGVAPSTKGTLSD
ncbi:imidazoleglycerol-phosphate dehydratase [Magnetococcus marinus MC-1]|uniref:Imidazoleglycerol-phosphate dehydratase n=1 Tax=Magnetococcus marinus (strain ATCC BAA-1437 / JCM 17883 / MC-1) TaxID=156889 RepID=HIS7_MAGMM|nr:imidazoleglycerol-phosphate dehydratase HisB [Magnetococcus marinus]A0LBT6.1 RecName: Full=Imidazoleglycerol-phosphate dehydratase; Short=IGPD [Magnetococcus marinus MC-1]ABK45429.1 imidazoleglycerol-phosphate dehydratase [Magnetococcus marinus MC-1]